MLQKVTLAGLLLLIAVVNAQPPNVTCADGSTAQGRLTVTGQGSVMTVPDTAVIDLTVTATRPNATDAREAGAAATNATLAALVAIGVPASDVKTTGLYLMPNYEYEPMTGASKVKGTTFTENIQVKIVNATEDTLSAVLDAVIAAGGNTVQVSGVNLVLSPEKGRAMTNQARKLAVADGLNIASVLAEAAAVSLGPVTSISDTNYNPPMMAQSAMPETAMDSRAGADTKTQYVIGEYETQASVNLELALCKAGTV